MEKYTMQNGGVKGICLSISLLKKEANCLSINRKIFTQ